MRKRLSSLLILLLSGWCVQAQSPFNSNDIVVFQAASASASNTTGSILELGKSISISPVQTITINGTTGANAMRFSGSATSTGYLSRTSDGSLLTFLGGNTTSTTGNINTVLTRGLGTLDSNGNYNLAATYTGTSGNQTRSATSLDNVSYYIGDQGGLYTNNATTASPTGNFRNIHGFGGTVYGSAASTTTIQVGNFSAITGGTYSGLPGLPSNSSLQDFYMIQSGSNGSTYDVLYTVSATSNTAGTIAKFSLVSGTWTANGTSTTTFGGFGLAAEPAGGGANLYITTGQGALSGNAVVELTDSGGYNTTLSLGGSTTLFTTPTGTVMKGIELAPAVPEPSVLLAVGAVAAFGIRRRIR
jgi:hypothetical protein